MRAGRRAKSVLIAMAVGAIPCLAQAQEEEPPEGEAPEVSVSPDESPSPPEAPATPVPPPPGARATPPPSGAHEHEGVYFRLYAGLGFLRFGDGQEDGERIYEGRSTSFGFGVGRTIARNVALFGTFISSIAYDPDFRRGGAGLQAPRVVDGSTNLLGLGGGIAIYVEALNVYLSAAIAVTQLRLSDTMDLPHNAGPGLGGQAMVGKEWWVSPNWGVGFAGEVIWASWMKDGQAGAPYSVYWKGGALALVFSATYN
jgi:hypothetical protein